MAGPLGFDEAMRRAQSFADASADAVFVDAPESFEELESIGPKISAPTLANMSEPVLTPLLGAEKSPEIGFNIAFSDVITPGVRPSCVRLLII